MSAVTVTATLGTTCHYWFTPQATISFTGAGLNRLDIVHGYSAEVTDQTPAAVVFTLDDSALWDVRLDLQGAAPVVFDGLNVAGGGDLFTLLNAQGWIPL